MTRHSGDWQFTIPCGLCHGDACEHCRHTGEVFVELNYLMVEAAAKAIGSERVGDIQQMHAERALIAALRAAQEEWNDRISPAREPAQRSVSEPGPPT